MSFDHYKATGIKHFISFSDHYFKPNKTYSRLVLSEEFYKPFLEHEYMLIAQTDTLILNIEYTIEQFMDKGYDYWQVTLVQNSDTPWDFEVEGYKNNKELIDNHEMYCIYDAHHDKVRV